MRTWAVLLSWNGYVQSASKRTEQRFRADCLHQKLKVRAHQLFFRTWTKNIHFHAIRFVQNTARNSALTNMCVLVPPRMIVVIQNGDFLMCTHFSVFDEDSLLGINRLVRSDSLCILSEIHS